MYDHVSTRHGHQRVHYVRVGVAYGDVAHGAGSCSMQQGGFSVGFTRILGGDDDAGFLHLLDLIQRKQVALATTPIRTWRRQRVASPGWPVVGALLHCAAYIQFH